MARGGRRRGCTDRVNVRCCGSGLIGSGFWRDGWSADQHVQWWELLDIGCQERDEQLVAEGRELDRLAVDVSQLCAATGLSQGSNRS